jgi:heptosyltransferase-2
LTEAAEDRGFGWRHEVDYALDVVGVVGAQHPDEPRLELAMDATDVRVPSGVLLVPGSGSFSRARRWAPERFAAVGRMLWERHGLAPYVLSGTAPDEQRLAERIASDIGPHARLLAPASSPQKLGALVRERQLVIANDGGVVHVATAVGTPVVAIFGPSNDRAWGPYPSSDPKHQVVREQLACAPCIHRGHSFGTPQGCPARTCLALVEPDHVVFAAERALGIGSERLVTA